MSTLNFHLPNLVTEWEAFRAEEGLCLDFVEADAHGLKEKFSRVGIAGVAKAIVLGAQDEGNSLKPISLKIGKFRFTITVKCVGTQFVSTTYLVVEKWGCDFRHKDGVLTSKSMVGAVYASLCEAFLRASEINFWFS